jgi:hypothetical protein
MTALGVRPASDDRICGDCGEKIGDDADVVTVGPDVFHADCYLPPSWLSNVRDDFRRQRESEPRSRPDRVERAQFGGPS